MKRNRGREITDKSEEGKRLENQRKTSRVRDVKDRVGLLKWRANGAIISSIIIPCESQ